MAVPQIHWIEVYLTMRGSPIAQAAFAILHVSVACCPLASRARPQMRRSEVHSRKYCLTERGLGQIFLVVHSHGTLFSIIIMRAVEATNDSHGTLFSIIIMRAVEATNVTTIKYYLCACITGNIVSQSVVSGKYSS